MTLLSADAASRGDQAEESSPTLIQSPNHLLEDSASRAASPAPASAADPGLQSATREVSSEHESSFTRALHASKDPIWYFDAEEALRLVNTWHAQWGDMYPILGLDGLLSHAEGLLQFVEAARRTGLMRGDLPGADGVMDENTVLLKLVLGIALTTKNEELGEKLYNNVSELVERSCLKRADHHGIRLWCLAVRLNCRGICLLRSIAPGNVLVVSRQRAACLALHRACRSILHGVRTSPRQDVPVPVRRRALCCNEALLVRVRSRSPLVSQGAKFRGHTGCRD